MPCYNLKLADICIQLDTPFSVTIGDELSPFLLENADTCHCRILFQAEPGAIPALPPDGRWIQDRYYTTYHGANAVFVRNTPDQYPYALITQMSNGFLCRYIPEFERFFYNSADILNVIGVESLLLQQGGLLLHASLICWQNRGILFSAPSGTGKSTQADLWETFMGSQTLNGDRAGIRCKSGVWTAFGMPFAGTSGIYCSDCAPIAAIVVLGQSPQNTIRRLKPMEALRKLLPECSCRRWDPQFMDQVLSLLLAVVQQVPVYQLECRPDREAVELLYDTITKEEIT